ncbi:hypothetical protein AURDEDRAFT_161616 [Auricularia subglabra TFB-10046 SS5]|nr:hypothetical protein AURDEDRAFT_161616 [Auricularia subglabra TFB-10046 SS5]
MSSSSYVLSASFDLRLDPEVAPQYGDAMLTPFPSTSVFDALGAQVPLGGPELERLFNDWPPVAVGDIVSPPSTSGSVAQSLLAEDPSPAQDAVPLFPGPSQGLVPTTEQMTLLALPDTTTAAIYPIFDSPVHATFDFSFAAPSGMHAFGALPRQDRPSMLGLDLGHVYNPPLDAYPPSAYYSQALSPAAGPPQVAVLPAQPLPAPPQPAALPTPPRAATPLAAPRNPRKRTISVAELEHHLSLPRAKKSEGKRTCTVSWCRKRIVAEQLKRHLETHLAAPLKQAALTCDFPGCRSRPFSRNDSLHRHRKRHLRK